MVLRKPAMLHDRDADWTELSEFVTNARSGATLGLVYGRRRQGKTLMLELLSEASDGFMITGQQQSSRQNLNDLSAAYARYLGVSGASFADWREAINGLLGLGERTEQPTSVVLDEFPYLLDSEPALASMLQAALSPRSRARRSGRARLILCGSGLTVMHGLLAGSAPLRGRAALELTVHPFDYREAAAFWGLRDQYDLAFRVHSLVGGTPAYLEMSVEVPTRASEFDSWVVRRLLSPASAMFREGNTLLHEQPGIGDPTPYHSVLAAISRGAHRRGEIASALGRADSALTHPLTMLEQIRLVERVADAFRGRRAVYRITEPAIRFHQLVVRPHEARLVRGAGRQVWDDAAETVSSLISGPHLEDLAREWCLSYAHPQTTGGPVGQVRPAVLACRTCRHGHEVDIVVTAAGTGVSGHVTAIGEVKARAKQVGISAVERLEHIRELVPSDRVTDPPKLLLFSRAGFTGEVREFSRQRGDVELVDLPRLYTEG